MSLISRSPFSLLNEIQRDMNRLFDNRMLTGSQSLLSNTGDWIPAVDIHEDKENYHLVVDLPGLKPEDIDVTAHDGILSLRGKRESIHEDKELKRSERVFGSFVREFSMPENADLDNIQAKYDNGVLAVVIPKSAKAEPKRIAVQ